jgi:ribose transport system substrate-binding protein
MSNVLASHSNIDGILTQDVMAEGIINAFEAANRELPRVMTGDYTAGFLRRWDALPDLESIAVPYSPTYGADSIKFAVRLLQGRKIKESELGPNPLDESLVNTVLLPPPLVVTREGDNSAPWCTASTECINLDEALKRVEGKPDTYMMEAGLSSEQVDSYFE